MIHAHKWSACCLGQCFAPREVEYDLTMSYKLNFFFLTSRQAGQQFRSRSLLVTIAVCQKRIDRVQDNLQLLMFEHLGCFSIQHRKFRIRTLCIPIDFMNVTFSARSSGVVLFFMDSWPHRSANTVKKLS